MGKMLGPQEISSIRRCMTNFDSEGIGLYVRSVKAMIDAFEDQNVVQSLYATGKFGEDTKGKLENYVKIINDFRESYLGEGGLVEQTHKYLNTVEEENNRRNN